ncbi:hypothetical protein [Shewanella sp. MBTL60-007]|uniref:hypothetical protein n=1 Tax=Shewanella sp. MBTL60-007 TaxID=2815911 RepID=UPI001BBFF15F|nr:hypothetical protein [Shewanella sp. MBTL60-007]GIU13098.1 hypothetical protein TUM3792_02380 [Shewanella sp. MBTL60-007]
MNSSTLLDNMFNSLFFNESVESILYRRGTFPLENNEVCYFSTIEEVLSVSSFLEKSLHEVYSFDTDYEQKMNEEFKCKMTLLSNLMFDDAIRQIELYLNQEIHLFSKNPPDWSDLSNAFKQQDNGDKMAATISKG